jgi:hypothetical protein
MIQITLLATAQADDLIPVPSPPNPSPVTVECLSPLRPKDWHPRKHGARRDIDSACSEQVHDMRSRQGRAGIPTHSGEAHVRGGSCRPASGRQRTPTWRQPDHHAGQDGSPSAGDPGGHSRRVSSLAADKTGKCACRPSVPSTWKFHKLTARHAARTASAICAASGIVNLRLTICEIIQCRVFGKVMVTTYCGLNRL